MSTTKPKLNIAGGRLCQPVDTSNDRMMVDEGLRVPPLSINRKVFEKTQSEKNELKRIKTKNSPKGIKFIQKYESLIPMQLVVYCKYSPKVVDFKSTHSYKCLLSEVSGILQSLKDSGYIIKDVYFNDTIYKI